MQKKTLTPKKFGKKNVRKTGLLKNIARFPEKSNDGPSANEPEVRSGIVSLRVWFKNKHR